MTLRSIIKQITDSASQLYSHNEAQMIAQMAVEHFLDLTPTQRIMKMDDEFAAEWVEDVAQQIAAGRPIQYIIGEVEFYGVALNVSEGVLIPRPETEEMVDLIIRNHPSARAIADVCTGSGAIAIALKSQITNAKVYGLDLSSEALQIARSNSTEVEFVQGDALNQLGEFLDNELDVVVSNPPYIPQSDITSMHANVVNHEPHMALFVPDNDPLLFYRAIATQSYSLLANDGAIYFEIYEDFADQMIELLTSTGYKEARITNDINNKPRIAWAFKRP